MPKHKKLVMGSGITAALILLLHFVPFDSRTGYLDKGISNLCIGYGGPVDVKFRWITGGVNAWDEDLSYLVSKNPGCAEPVHLRLYIL